MSGACSTSSSPAGKDSAGFSRNASAPTLTALLAQRPLQRQLLPPLEVSKTPTGQGVSPSKPSLLTAASTPTVGEDLLFRRTSRRTTKTLSISEDKVSLPEHDADSEAHGRKPRRCGTGHSVATLMSEYPTLHSVSCGTLPSTPHSATSTISRACSMSLGSTCCSPLTHVEGEEGQAWTRGSRLGAGSYGAVYKAMERCSGRMFAVKELSLNDRDGNQRRKLDSELEICRSLRHPNIVSYLGHSFTSEHLFIYLEYVPGGSMSSVLNEFGPLKDGSLRKAIAGMLEGLHYLHTQTLPVVHRDIKAANLLVDLEMHVKLADFGCSKCSADTQSFTTVGSVPWMAPEVMLLEGGHGRKADIWSVGCTVLELATGENPWGKNAFDNIMYAMQHIALTNSTPPIPDHLPFELKDMVTKCVNRIAPQRPQAKTLLEHPFLSS